MKFLDVVELAFGTRLAGLSVKVPVVREITFLA